MCPEDFLHRERGSGKIRLYIACDRRVEHELHKVTLRLSVKHTMAHGDKIRRDIKLGRDIWGIG
jgi:hypothetical protein